MARPGLKVRLTRTLQVRLLNPRHKRIAGMPGVRAALLETVGRKTRERRQTPVLYGLDGDTLWIVSMFGQQAHYVRNILAEPRVRVKVGGSWRGGTARVVEDDDAKARIARIDPLNTSAARRYGTDHLTVRVDLDPRAS
jgi:deazaflavin-dependent oxidoreductase (nitroreductase family)